MGLFGWSYPPGVSGNEYAIAGPDYEQEFEERSCPECGSELMEHGYRRERWVTCTRCKYHEDLPFIEKGGSG